MNEVADYALSVQLNTPMIVSAIVLLATFIGIFTETLHKIHRTTIAMAGAGVMVILGQIYGFYDPERALHAIDWNVVFLLGAMMAFVNIMIPTGGFQAIAYWIARTCQGRPFMLMVMMGTSIAVLSMFLNNLTTVVVFAPLIVLICQVLGISPLPHLMIAAILSNIGGVATLVGDPPNLMIGSAADIGFAEFFERMSGTVFVAYVAIIASLYFLFKRHWRKRAYGKYFSDNLSIADKPTWYVSISVLLLMIVLFMFHNTLGWEAWIVSGIGLTVMFLFKGKEEPDSYLEKVELSLLLFFIALFILVGGVEESRFLIYIGKNIQPLVESDMLVACLILLWVSAVFSALIDNIPFTAAMIPVILGLEAQGVSVEPLWWSLALGVGLGANGSHLGSTVNLFVMTLSEKMAKRERKAHLAITTGLWLKRGGTATFVTLCVTSVIFYMFFDFFSKPLNAQTDDKQAVKQVQLFKAEEKTSIWSKIFGTEEADEKEVYQLALNDPSMEVLWIETEKSKTPVKFDIELAITPNQMRQGLMYRKEIEDDYGMLFWYDQEKELAFWMKNTLIPLDIIFINSEGIIHHVHENAKPLDETPIPSNGSVRAVLEISGGMSKKLGISPGDVVIHKLFNR